MKDENAGNTKIVFLMSDELTIIAYDYITEEFIQWIYFVDLFSYKKVNKHFLYQFCLLVFMFYENHHTYTIYHRSTCSSLRK